jgi:hypothetical protein
MTTTHSSSTNKATFIRHLPFESATSLADAKYIATDRAETYRYKYRGVAILAGDAGVKVGQLIYLDGLSQGMSGYWTVLRVDHVFGSGNASYQLEVLLGTDILGDVSDNVGADTEVRDFAAELAEQSLDAAPSTLTDYSFGINAGKVESSVAYAPSSKVVAPAYAPAAPTSYDPDIYKNEVPNFSSVKRTTTWAAK